MSHFGLLGFTWVHLCSFLSRWVLFASLGFTWIHLHSLWVTWVHLRSLEFTLVHLNNLRSLGFTLVHFVLKYGSPTLCIWPWPLRIARDSEPREMGQVCIIHVRLTKWNWKPRQHLILFWAGWGSKSKELGPLVGRLWTGGMFPVPTNNPRRYYPLRLFAGSLGDNDTR